MLRIKIKRATNIPVAPITPAVPRAISRRRAMVNTIARRVGIGLAAVVLLSIGFQLVYPGDFTLPYAQLGGTATGVRTRSELMIMLQNSFATSKVEVTAGPHIITDSLAHLGATLDADTTVSQLTNYPWWQRLLPFSCLWLRPTVQSASVAFNDTRLDEASAVLAKRLSSEPKNGTVTIVDTGEITVAAAEDGVTVTADMVKNDIKKAAIIPGTTKVTITPTFAKPTVTNEKIMGVKDSITAALAVKITVQNSLDEKQAYMPDKKAVASWITIGDDLALNLNKDAVAGYARTAAKSSLIAAGTTKVTTVDGVETGRTVGAPGRDINNDALVADLTKALLGGGSAQVPLQFAATAPVVSYDRTYSHSQTGLQAYVNEVSAGKDTEISVRQLSGNSWSASTGASKSVVSASTYKLFISLLLFNKINDGQLEWTDTTQGTTVETCLKNTIVVSANNCAEQWIKNWGGGSGVNSALRTQGFSNATSFATPDAIHTSVADLQRLLIGLNNRSLFTGADGEKLLSYMKQQVYRSGIPAGSAGTVADKVGFLWDYLNDAAIVYHPRGTYVLVVMTKGQSWAKIAEITRQLEAIMYP